jgi:sugar phosphate isomerase/epimerase
MTDYTLNFYQGGYSSLKPSYGDLFTGYRIAAKDLGMSTDPRTANVLQEVSTKLNMGITNIELSQVTPEVFESIPKGQLKEVNRLSKLTGTDITLHAPVVEPSGVTQQGFDESSRETAERQMTLATERANELNPDGSSPVTFHSSAGLPGTEYEITPRGKKPKKLIVVDRDSGKVVQALEKEKLYYPAMIEEGKIKPGITQKEIEEFKLGKLRPSDIFERVPLKEGKVHTPEMRLQSINSTQWDNAINQVFFNKERADEILQQNQLQIAHLQKELDEGKIKKDALTPNQKQAFVHVENAKSYLDDTRQQIDGLFHKAYKYGTDEEKNFLHELSNSFQNALDQDPSIAGQSNAVQKLILGLKKVTPKMHIPAEEFLIEKSSKTFGNVAFNSFKKFKDKAPIISIENPPGGIAISTGEDLKKLVEKSKENFIKKAIEEEGLSEKQAKKQADKLIGVTWDVGHINMLRKQGFKGEEIIRETELIAPFVKHVHLSDNFGLEHTELPMGMGNVPIKEIMKRLGKEGFKGKKIIEAAHWWQHFKTSPFMPTMEALGSPVYSMQMAPYWNQALALQQGYSSGYGMMLPEIGYKTFGAGFSQLPAELGGQRQATGGRMSGTPME